MEEVEEVPSCLKVKCLQGSVLNNLTSQFTSRFFFSLSSLPWFLLSLFLLEGHPFSFFSSPWLVIFTHDTNARLLLCFACGGFPLILSSSFVL